MVNGLIEIHGLTKNYGKKKALSDINLTLNSGKIIGLLGPNGSGKTTLIKILNGLLKNYQGEVKIDGHSIDSHTKSIVSYLPDETYFQNWMRISDALNIFTDMYKDFDLDKAKGLLARMDLNEKMLIKTMSKGMKERFQLVLVMSRKAMVYILDEPIGGVDPAARDVILDIILNNYNEDSIVLLSTHLISDIESIFEEVIFIKNGEIVLHDDAEKIREKEGKSIDELFREEFKWSI